MNHFGLHHLSCSPFFNRLHLVAVCRVAYIMFLSFERIEPQNRLPICLVRHENNRWEKPETWGIAHWHHRTRGDSNHSVFCVGSTHTSLARVQFRIDQRRLQLFSLLLSASRNIAKRKRKVLNFNSAFQSFTAKCASVAFWVCD